MGLPNQPVSLTPEQLAELNRSLSNLRHDVNNHLSLIVAAIELVRYKPHLVDRMMATLGEQPPKITEALTKFTAQFERTLGITRS